MHIGLIDVDGHNFPNLALMRISAYHKKNGDAVEWYQGGLFRHYDIVYKSKIFSDEYTKDIPDPINADKVIKGGSGYAIELNGEKEVFRNEKHSTLPDEIEKMFPDYSIYPQYPFAVAMTSRGCPRGCSFCHVAAKEGRKSIKVADVSDFWGGQKEIKILDPNITACSNKHELFEQYIATGAILDFTQGLDVRLLTEKDMEYINAMRLRTLHFAWDNAKEDLLPYFKKINEQFRRKKNGMVYVLTGYDTTIEEDLYRIYSLRNLNYDPYVMIYNKPNADKKLKRLQRWCNNKIIFGKVKNFEDYM